MKSNKVHILLGAVISIPVFWAALTYLNFIHVGETEAVATAVTICVFGFLYVGRYFAMLAQNYLPIPITRVYTVLGAIIGISFLWLLIYPDFNTLHSRPGINLLLYWVPFAILVVSSGMLIKLIRTNAKHLIDAQLTASHSQSELKLLQSQISPHFLFNTLNNLYGISLTRHEKIPPLLLKLSELLRYSVYDAKELFVPLKDELAYINNYIEFEKIRIGDRLEINTTIDDNVEGLQIAPMILIIFVENAFKHSKNSTDQNIFVDIELKTWANSILFSIKNSFQANEETGIAEKYSGFGLDNVKKRLELLYPEKYDLKMEVDKDFYKVMLQLKVRQ